MLAMPSISKVFERWYASEQMGERLDHWIPPMFVPFELKDLKLSNRIAVSPMAMYSAKGGLINDFHLVHLGARALGGAGLVFTEMVCTAADARITPGCAGIWNDEQTQAWRRVVDFVHEQTSAKIAIQIGHAGRKGSTQLGWQTMDAPLENDNWPLVAPSPIAWSDGNQIPNEITKEQMAAVRDNFVSCARRANQAGFDMIEIHCAHGYLLSSFISPLTNKRTDEYGGSLENRLRFPLEIIHAVKEVWPQSKPLSVRISATDWCEGGVDIEESVAVSRILNENGVDIIGRVGRSGDARANACLRQNVSGAVR